jgi:DNA mismatch repair protein MutS
LKEGIIASGSHFVLSETQHNKVQHITAIQRIAEDMFWDRFTIRNLELYHSYNPNAVTLY